MKYFLASMCLRNIYSISENLVITNPHPSVLKVDQQLISHHDTKTKSAVLVMRVNETITERKLS